MAAPKRAVRVRRGPAAVTTSDKSRLTKRVNEYFGLEAEVAALNARMAEIEAEMLAELKKHNIEEWKGAEGTAELQHPVGRSSSSIDAEEFRKLVSEKDFLSCVTVAKGKAEKVLSGKELERITTVTPGEKKPDTVVFRRFKKQ